MNECIATGRCLHFALAASRLASSVLRRSFFFRIVTKPERELQQHAPAIDGRHLLRQPQAGGHLEERRHHGARSFAAAAAAAAARPAAPAAATVAGVARQVAMRQRAGARRLLAGTLVGEAVAQALEIRMAAAAAANQAGGSSGAAGSRG